MNTLYHFRSMVVRLPALVLCLVLALGVLPAVAGGDMEAAKKEGKVVWYCSLALPISQKLSNTFNAKKLGVEAVLHRSGSGKIYRRWLQEAKSGIFEADIIHTSNIAHFVTLKKQGQIIKYRPPGTDKFNPAFVEKEGYWTILRAFAYVISYNTKLVKKSDLPKSWLDLFDPKWKGKIVNAHPGYSGAVSIGMSTLVKRFGWEFMDKLAAQKPLIVQSAVDTPSYLGRGEALISSGSGTYNTFYAILKGEPVANIFPKEGAPFITSPQAILKKAPHPNAAKVFSDWLFSSEAQQIVANNGLHVGHPEVKYPAAQIPLKDIKLLKITPEDAVKMRKPIRDAFRKKFGV